VSTMRSGKCQESEHGRVDSLGVSRLGVCTTYWTDEVWNGSEDGRSRRPPSSNRESIG